jgi:hypothetical protein
VSTLDTAKPDEQPVLVHIVQTPEANLAVMVAHDGSRYILDMDEQHRQWRREQ